MNIDFHEDQDVFVTLTIFALMIRCPAGFLRSSQGCPFAGFRVGIGLEERFRIAEGIPLERGLAMLAAHEVCQAKGEKEGRVVERSHVAGLEQRAALGVRHLRGSLQRKQLKDQGKVY